MRAQKILRRLAIIFIVGCVIFLAIDILKTLKVNIDYNKMQDLERVSLSSNVPKLKYEPTDYKIDNKQEVIEQVKNIVVDLKNRQSADEVKDLFEIGNINKIQELFYNYEQYTVVKYKLLNIIEDMPKLYLATKDYSNEQLQSYFNDNSSYIEKYYGFTDNNEFTKFVKSLKFLGNNKINFAVVRSATIMFDYDTDTLTFSLKLEAGGNNAIYFVKVRYYESSDNQIKPYVEISVIE